MRIGYALYLTGEINYPEHLKNKITFIGDFKAPIAFGTYKELYSNLDEDFYKILSIFKWHKTGLISVNIDDLTYAQAVAVKYLIEYNDSLKQRII